MKFKFGSTLLLTVLLGVGIVGAQEDNPDQVTDGEQRVDVSSRSSAATFNRYRQALAGVDGVAEVSGNRAVIFRPEPASNLRWSTVARAVNGDGDPTTWVVGPLTLGFSLTVHVVFKADQVRPEQVPAIIEAMPTYDTLTEVTYVSGTTIRIRTAPWSLRNQHGFRVLSLLGPAAGATGYQGPGSPTFDRFIEDVIFEPSGS